MGAPFVASLLIVAMPGAPSSFLFLVVRPGAPISSFPECVAKGSRLTLGGLGVEPCSRPVASMFATVRNRSQPSATVRNRSQ